MEGAVREGAEDGGRPDRGCRSETRPGPVQRNPRREARGASGRAPRRLPVASGGCISWAAASMAGTRHSQTKENHD